jgi:tRNA modification GTPase
VASSAFRLPTSAFAADTIAALASAPGPAATGIVRLSGPDVVPLLNALFTPRDRERWERCRLPRRHPGTLSLPTLRTPLSVDVHLWPGTRSYTGQPAAELHAVGSPPLLEAVLAELYRRDARPARPGEFTLRAFLAGRIDLVQAEAVLEVIDSADPPALEAALRQLAGGISGRIRAVHDGLVDLLADLEAGLDFVEEDIEFVSRENVIDRLAAAREIVDELLRRSTDRMVSPSRVRVVLAGLPNAGKSTLFNALSGTAAALVSGDGGTTRDYLRAELDWDGLPVELIDTAGWEQASDGISAAAQQLRDDLLRRADVVVWCTAADLPGRSFQPESLARERLAATAQRFAAVRTKSDLDGSDRVAVPNRADVVALSAVTGDGLADLRMIVRDLAGHGPAEAGGLLGSTAARCRGSLRAAVDATVRAVEAARAGVGEELIAAELREAIDAFGWIVGATCTDDLLDRIFSRFCIGK